MFLFERSYTSISGEPSVLGAPDYYGMDAEETLFNESQLSPHFALMRTMNEQTLFFDPPEKFLYNIFLTTQFRFRFVDIPSKPVRSMSAMPRFVIQAIRGVKGWSDNELSGRRGFLGLNLIIGHHSNGGDGCEFQDEVIPSNIPNAGCVGDPSIPNSEKRVKVRGGNFSTNYLELGTYGRIGYVLDEAVPYYKWALEFGAALQVHHNMNFPIPGGAVPTFRGFYKSVRPRIDIQGHYTLRQGTFFRGWISVEPILLGGNLDRYPGAEDYRLEMLATVHLNSPRIKSVPLRRLLNSFGVGVRWARGQDYYNLQYIRNIDLFQLVVVIDPWSPFMRSEE